MKKPDLPCDAVDAARALLPAILDATENLIVILDTEGRVCEFNRACAEATGYHASEIRGREVWDFLIPGDEVDDVKTHFRELLSSSTIGHHTNHWLTGDGSTRTIEWTSTVVVDDDGRPRFVVGTGVDVTDLRKMEEESRQSASYLSNMMDALHEDILVVDRDYRVTDLNAGVLRTTGRRREDVIGLHCYEISHGYNQPCSEMGEDCALVRVFETGQPESCRHIQTAFDGSPRHVDVVLAPLLNPAGEVTHVIESARDVTKLVAAIERLENSESRFGKIVDSMTDGFAIDDPDGFLTFVNPALCDMLGCAREDLIGSQLAEYLHPASREKLWEQSVKRSVDATADTESYELTAIRVNGEPIELLASPQRLVDAWGEFAGSFAVLTDITRIKRMERTQALLGTAIEQAAESVVITDADGTIQYVNPAFERASGYAADEVLGGNPRVLRSGEHDDEFYRDLWETITSGRVWSGQFTNLKRDGTLFQEEATISPVRDETGKIAAFVAVKRDVSVERRLEDKLNRAQRLEALGELAGGIAHDFNNLLMHIAGSIELLRLRLIDDSESQSEFKLMSDTVSRGADLTRRLLSVAHQQVLEMEVLDFNEVIAKEIVLLRRLLPDSVAAEFRPSSDPLAVLGDRGQVGQVLGSLFLNARDAMPDGGSITISTSVVTLDALTLSAHPEVDEGRYVRLSVQDSGIGMDADVRDRVFDPFFTTKMTTGGSGMGLATVYGIVRQHDGMVEVESRRGAGSRFDLYFPLSAEAPAKTGRTSKGAAVGGSETILVVEDDERVRRTQVKMLRALGYSVLEAENGRVALDTLIDRGSGIDMILSDVSMPKMGGQELFDRAREVDPDLVFVFTSGYAGTGFIDRFQKGETVHFLAKPHTMAQLAGMIREALSEAG